MRLLPYLLALALSGCAASKPSTTQMTLELPPIENRMDEQHAPTPFSAAELHAGIPDGCSFKFRIEQVGEEAMIETTTFNRGDENEVNFTIETNDTTGAEIKAPFSATAPWSALQSHASFPLDSVVLSVDSHTTALGSADCWLYVVTRTVDEQTSVSRFWFDPSRPGPPIEYTTEVNGEVQTRAVMFADSRNS